MSVTIFKSTDTNAPPLTGTVGSLHDVLYACLVTGIGPYATASIAFSGNPADGDTLTIGSTTYRFKSTMAAINDIKIGAGLANSLNSLVLTIAGFGVSGTDYFAGTTTPNNEVIAQSGSASPLLLRARVTGTGGNSLALAKSSTVITVPGANMTGGGSVTATAAGWARTFSGANKGAFQGGSGIQHYFDLDDSIGSIPKEMSVCGFEVMASMSPTVGVSGKFPTDAQVAGWYAGSQGWGLSIRKSTSNDLTNRPWIVIADDRTCYVFTQTGDTNNTSGLWWGYGFGEIFSILSTTDLYRSFVMAGPAANSGAGNTVNVAIAMTSNLVTQAGHYMARSYTGIGGAAAMGKIGDWARGNVGSASVYTFGGSGTLAPNPVDGNVHIVPVSVVDAGPSIRGRLRGFFHNCANSASFADQDTITGSGAYAGHTFIDLKSIGVSGFGGHFCIDITGPWETN